MRNKEKKMDMRQTFASRNLRAGSYSLAVCAIALVIVIVVNLIVGSLPVKVTEKDLSHNKLFSLSDYSKQITQSIDTNVTIYHMTRVSSEDKLLSSLLQRYESLNENIHVEMCDPELSQIATKYTKEELYDNSLIFVSAKRYKVVDYYPSIVGYSDEYEAMLYYQQYNQIPDYDESYAEREITSALSYVTSDVQPKAYTLAGHGEFEMEDTLQTLAGLENIELTELDLMKEKKIPEDCACLVILAPDTDLSENELSLIEAFWDEGGRLLLAPTLKAKLKGDTPNFDALLDNLGIEAKDGLIYEGDMAMCYSRSGYFYQLTDLIPNLKSHVITDPLIQYKYDVFFPDVRELAVSAQHRSSLQIEPLLTTSEKSFARSDLSVTSIDKMPEDTDGPFDVAYAVSEQMEGKTARAVVFGSSDFLTEMYAGNMNLFLNSLKWMCGMEENISMVETKSLANNESLEVSNNAFYFWGMILTLVIPGAVLIVGIVIFVTRKKR